MKLTTKTIVYIQLAFGLISTIYIMYNFYQDYQAKKIKRMAA